MKLRDRLARIMYGRYGQDELSRALSVLVLVFLFASMLSGLSVLYLLGLALLVYSLVRSFSRNFPARRREREVFLRLWNKLTGFFKGLARRRALRKTHKLLRCPACRQRLSVPKGRGKLHVKCPKCGNGFDANS